MQMSARSIVIYYGGEWLNNIYNGGERRFLLVPQSGITYASLLNQVQVLVGADKNHYMLLINSLVQLSDGDNVRMDINTELDLKFVMDRFEVPKFYVTVSRILSENSRHVAAPQPSFVNLLNSQIAFQYAHTFKNQASSESRCDLSVSGDMDHVEKEVNEDNEYDSLDDGGELNEVDQPVSGHFPT